MEGRFLRLEHQEAVLDTSVWIALLNGEPSAERVRSAQGTRKAVITPIILADLVASMRRGRVAAASGIRDVEGVARLEPLTREDAIHAGETFAGLRARGNRKVSLADCLVFATAKRIGAPMITLDADLRGETGVIVL